MKQTAKKEMKMHLAHTKYVKTNIGRKFTNLEIQQS